MTWAGSRARPKCSGHVLPGRIVEFGPVGAIFAAPLAPLYPKPAAHYPERGTALSEHAPAQIPGLPPDMPAKPRPAAPFARRSPWPTDRLCPRPGPSLAPPRGLCRGLLGRGGG